MVVNPLFPFWVCPTSRLRSWCSGPHSILPIVPNSPGHHTVSFPHRTCPRASGLGDDRKPQIRSRFSVQSGGSRCPAPCDHSIALLRRDHGLAPSDGMQPAQGHLSFLYAVGLEDDRDACVHSHAPPVGPCSRRGRRHRRSIAGEGAPRERSVSTVAPRATMAIGTSGIALRVVYTRRWATRRGSSTVSRGCCGSCPLGWRTYSISVKATARAVRLLRVMPGALKDHAHCISHMLLGGQKHEADAHRRPRQLRGPSKVPRVYQPSVYRVDQAPSHPATRPKPSGGCIVDPIYGGQLTALITVQNRRTGGPDGRVWVRLTPCVRCP